MGDELEIGSKLLVSCSEVAAADRSVPVADLVSVLTSFAVSISLRAGSVVIIMFTKFFIINLY